MSVRFSPFNLQRVPNTLNRSRQDRQPTAIPPADDADMQKAQGSPMARTLTLLPDPLPRLIFATTV